MHPALLVVARVDSALHSSAPVIEPRHEWRPPPREALRAGQRHPALATLGLVAVMLSGVMACEPGGSPAPRAVTLGPWLQLAGMSMSSQGASLAITRDALGWRLEPGPWDADERRTDALELGLRRQWMSVDSRTAALSADALGFLDSARIDVTIRPNGEPPIAVAVGLYREGCTWVRIGENVDLHCLEGDLRALVDGSHEGWRSRRIARFDDAQVVAATLGASFRAERSDGRWRSERGAVNGLQLDRLLRSIASASGDAERCEAGRTRATMLLEFGELRPALRLSSGGPDGRCMSIDGEPAYRIDAGLADAFVRAERAVRSVDLPALGTPDGVGTIAASGGEGELPERPLAEAPRAFVRAVTQVRSEALVPAAFRAVAYLPPQRRVILRLNDEPAHRMLLWWHADHRGVVARIDGGPLFFARNPQDLRSALEPFEGSESPAE